MATNQNVCDLCEESIPASDMEAGRAYLRGKRAICAACDKAMGGGGALPEVQGGGFPGGKSPFRAAFAMPFVTLTALGLAGYSLWEAHTAQKSLERLEARVEGDLQTERDRQERTWVAARRAMDQRLSVGDDAMRQRQEVWDAQLKVWQAEFDTRLGALRDGLEEQAEELLPLNPLREKIAALEAARASMDENLRTFEIEMERVEVEGNENFRLAFAELDDLSGRLAKIENAWINLDQIPVGDQAAPWFAITQELLHESPGVRLEAIYSLEQSHDARICAYLHPMLKDSDALIRVATARILAEHSFRPATPDLIEGLSDPLLSVRAACVDALRSITGRKFGYQADGRDSERQRPVKDWQRWWELRGEGFLAGEPG